MHPLILILVVVAVVLLTLFAVGDIHAGVIAAHVQPWNRG